GVADAISSPALPVEEAVAASGLAFARPRPCARQAPCPPPSVASIRTGSFWMSAKLKLRETGRFARRAQMPPSVIRPRTLKELRECLVPGSPYLQPFRPMGAGSSSTDCITATAGTVIDMSGFDEIVNIDAYEDTVVVQPGVRLGRLESALAEH